MGTAGSASRQKQARRTSRNLKGARASRNLKGRSIPLDTGPRREHRDRKIGDGRVGERDQTKKKLKTEYR
jgi:hypothetical protein